MSVTVAPIVVELARGVHCKNEGQYDEAVEIFRAILIDNPTHPETHMELGLVYGFTGLFDEAIAELEQAVSLNPESLEARLHLAKTYCMLGMDSDARREFERILEQDPFHEEAMNNMVYLNEEGTCAPSV